MNLVPRNFYFDDLFDNFLTPTEYNNLKCDIYEKDGIYNIEMDVPGFKKDDISIEVEDGYISIIASKKDAKQEEGKNYIRRERYSNEYKRKFYIGNVKKEEIKAKFEDGSLKIVIPVQEETPNKKVVEIE